jgi:TMEM175 potassium channel family protein
LEAILVEVGAAMDGSADPGQRRRTASSTRVEAFSDAVFAITITLLVLEIGRPEIGDGELASELLHQWPEYLAFAVSFVYIGAIWLNHHALFARIRRVDLGLNWINLGILGTSALIPFPTGVLASALGEGSHADQQAAVVLYGIVGALMSAAWLPVFPYLHRHLDLLVDPSEAQLFRAQRSRPWVGVISFAIAALVGYLLSPQVAILLFVWMIAYHAATSEGLHANKIARLFAGGRLRQIVAPVSEEHEDPNLESLERYDERTERTERAEPRDP